MLTLLALLLPGVVLGQSGPWQSQPAFYPLWPTRKTTVLNGTWSFGMVDPSAAGIITSGSYADITTPNTTQVPSCFDITEPGIKGVRTTVFYRSHHTCTTGTQAHIKFMAVNFFTRVFVDGVELGNHSAGPYTPFSFVAPACTGGVREIALMVNNQFNHTLSPTATGGDYYFFGGVIRPVIVTELPASPFYLDFVQPTTVDVDGGLIDLDVFFSGTPPTTTNVSLTLSFDGASPSPPISAAVVGGVAKIRGVSVPNPKPWTLGQGNLFTLTVTETTSGDAVTTRSGLRIIGKTTVGVPHTRLTINGQVVKLKGFNRHTLWPDTGAAVTPEQERIDLELVKGVNANYIRGGHYPQSQSWLDLLDENGIAIWEEALGPGVSTADILNPFFMENQVRAVTSMVHNSIHHPSVIMHGFFNEGPSSDSKACVGYQTLADTVRSLVGNPPTRYATWASDKGKSDVCLNASDVISFNNYPGWYGSPGNVPDAATTWKGNGDWVHANFPNHPFTVSETGGGGIYEWVNATSPAPGQFWSQKYQDTLVMADASYLLGDDRYTGWSLWLLFDFIVDDQSCGQCQYAPHPNNLTVPWDCLYINVECGGGASCLNKPCGRPGGINHKGALDMWRRKKLSYTSLSNLYGGV